MPVLVLPSVRQRGRRTARADDPPTPDQDQVVDVHHHLPYTRCACETQRTPPPGSPALTQTCGSMHARSLSTPHCTSSWLDYCDVAYFVAERYAREAMPTVLAMLAAVPEAELAAKSRRLRKVRAAFTFRHGASLAQPSAAEHILSEVCEAARQIKRAAAREGHEVSPPPSPRGGNHSRCVLVGPRRRQRPRGPWTRWPGRNPNQPTGGEVPRGYAFRHARDY